MAMDQQTMDGCNRRTQDQGPEPWAPSSQPKSTEPQICFGPEIQAKPAKTGPKPVRKAELRSKTSPEPHHPIHAYIHAYKHAYIHAYIHTYMPTYMPTYIHTYLHTCLHTYIPTYMPTCIHTYIHAYTHTYLHTYISRHCPYLFAPNKWTIEPNNWHLTPNNWHQPPLWGLTTSSLSWGLCWA